MKLKQIDLGNCHHTYFYKLTDLVYLVNNNDVKTYKIDNDTFLWSPEPFKIQIKNQSKTTEVEGSPFPSDRISRIFDTLELKKNINPTSININPTSINKQDNIYYCEIISVPSDRRKLNYKKVFENKENQLMPDNFYSFNPTGDKNLTESPLYIMSFVDTEPFGLFTFSKMENGLDYVEAFNSQIIYWKLKKVIEELTLPYLKSLPEYEYWISK